MLERKVSTEKRHEAYDSSFTVRDKDVLIKRLSLFLIYFGFALLLFGALWEIYARTRGGVAGSYLDSGADSYRFMVAIGVIIASGLIYSLGVVGRIIGWIVWFFVLQQAVYWSINRQDLGSAGSIWSLIDVTLFGGVILVSLLMIISLPRTWFRGWRARATTPPFNRLTDLGNRHR